MSDPFPPPPGTDFANEYDVRAWIPVFDATLAGWTQKSKLIRAQHPALLDQYYGSSPAETLDYFPPCSRTLRAGRPPPLLVFLHGGFWRRLDKSNFSWIAPAYTAAGIAVAIMNYGLAPATRLEEMVWQIRQGIRWLYTRAQQLDFDPQRIIVAGHSAGGHLTCMALCTDWTAMDHTLPGRLIAGGIILSPLADLAPLAHVPLLEADLHFTPERIATLSPIRQSLPYPVPVIAAVGGQESAEFRRQLALLAAAWPAVRKGCIEQPAENHLSICDRFADPDAILFNTALELISASPPSPSPP